MGLASWVRKQALSSLARCMHVRRDTLVGFSCLDCLVNNAAVQYYKHSILEITNEQLELTYDTNIMAMFWMVQVRWARTSWPYSGWSRCDGRCDGRP